MAWSRGVLCLALFLVNAHFFSNVECYNHGERGSGSGFQSVGNAMNNEYEQKSDTIDLFQKSTYTEERVQLKHVMKNVTVSPQSSNIHGIPLSNSEKFRIIGGVETNRNEFPFIVSFARHGRHFCGGAVIAPDWVLTAAHCASEPNFDVTAGEHNLNENEGPEQKSRAVLVIRNSKYNPNTYEDDICLVKVSPPFNYTEYVKPFAVPSTHYVASGNATVAGWGTEDEAFQQVSPVLRKVTVPLVPSMECSAQYGSYFHPLKMICAGEEEGGKDACQGDSGGPLMCYHHHKGATLCGIVSFGLGCARPELAGVYTKVAYYSDWIEYEIRTSGKELTPPPRRTTMFRQPARTTPAPVVETTRRRNPLENLPPGYEIIIKPVDPVTTPPPRKELTRTSGSTSLNARSITESIVLFSSSIVLVSYYKLIN